MVTMVRQAKKINNTVKTDVKLNLKSGLLKLDFGSWRFNFGGVPPDFCTLELSFGSERFSFGSVKFSFCRVKFSFCHLRLNLKNFKRSLIQISFMFGRLIPDMKERKSFFSCFGLAIDFPDHEFALPGCKFL